MIVASLAPSIMRDTHMAISTYSMMISLIDLATMPFEVGGLVLLIVALLRRRGPVGQAGPPPAQPMPAFGMPPAAPSHHGVPGAGGPPAGQQSVHQPYNQVSDPNRNDGGQ